MRKKHKIISALVVVLAVIVVVGVVYDKYSKKEREELLPPPIQLRLMDIRLHEQNNSGVAGSARILEAGGTLEVSMALKGFGPDSHPAHIHAGTCENLGEVIYSLSPVGSDGSSESILEATFDELLSQYPLAINIHKSKENISEYIACGNLPTETCSGEHHFNKDTTIFLCD